jgi:hypothetical protein
MVMDGGGDEAVGRRDEVGADDRSNRASMFLEF